MGEGSAVAVLGWALGLLMGGLALGLALVVVLPIALVAEGQLRPDRVDGFVKAAWPAQSVVVRADRTGRIEVWLVGRRVARFDASGSSEPSEPKVKGKAKRKRAGSGPSWRFVLRIIRRSLRSLRLRARIWGRLGPSDPADAGTLYAALVVVRRVLPGIDTRDLVVDWSGTQLELNARVNGRLWPLGLTVGVVREFVEGRT